MKDTKEFLKGISKEKFTECITKLYIQGLMKQYKVATNMVQEVATIEAEPDVQVRGFKMAMNAYKSLGEGVDELKQISLLIKARTFFTEGEDWSEYDEVITEFSLAMVLAGECLEQFGQGKKEGHEMLEKLVDARDKMEKLQNVFSKIVPDNTEMH